MQQGCFITSTDLPCFNGDKRLAADVNGDGVVYNVDTEHCFEGDPDFATIGFCIREPYGGFDWCL